MARLAKGLLFVAPCVFIGSEGALPLGFPCKYPPTVMEDATKGWPAACLGLTLQPSSYSTADACKNLCRSKDSCNVWQFVKPPVAEANECWIATSYYAATSCWGREGESGSTFKASAGQRLQHGTPVVIANITNVFYSGLTELGFFHTSESGDSTERCKRNCHSNIYCTKWQYHSSKGCFIVDQPGTQSGNNAEAVQAPATVVGEVIEHKCLPPPKPKEEEEESNLWWIIGAALITLLLLGIIAAVYFKFCHKKTAPRKNTTRAVKMQKSSKPPPALREEPAEVLVPLVPMPTIAPYQVAAQPAYQVAAQPAYQVVAQPSFQVVPEASTFSQPQAATFSAVPAYGY